jgi:hypothetical protein
LDAAAVAIGPDIFFNKGYDRQDEAGLRLLLHELVHVVQWQNGGAPDFVPLPSKANAWIDRPAEAEAEQVVDRLLKGGAARVRGSLPQRQPLAHPVYISRHGKRGFLTLARQFYQRWGYSPITSGVDSIEQILADLSTKPSIDRVTIVTHAHPTNMFIAMFNGGASQIPKDQWAVDTMEELVGTETHYIDESTLDDVIRTLRGNAENQRRLRRIGRHDDALVRQYIWWAIEYEYVSHAGFSRNRRRLLQRHIQTNMESYRDTILLAAAVAAGFGASAPSERDFNRLRQAIQDVTRAFRWPRPGRQERQIARQLQSSPTRTINRVLRGSFFQNLDTVRRKMRPGSWIEIQGCRVGQDRDYVTAVQRFFSSDRRRPRVTAPKWFQFFGNYGYTAVPDSPRQLRRQWARRQVRQAFDYWYPLLMGSPVPPGADQATLGDFLRTPHALPLAFPGRPGQGSVLFLESLGQEAFLRWLSRHGYRLTAVADIERALFTERTLGRNIRRSLVDWLQERRSSPTQIAFRPDPEYNRQIEDVR